MLESSINCEQSRVANFLGVEADLFFKEYWHKKPLHIKNQVNSTGFTPSITLDNVMSLFTDAYTCGNEIYAGFRVEGSFYKAWGLFDYMKEAGIDASQLKGDEFKNAVLSCLAKENNLEIDKDVSKYPWAVVLKYADYKNADLAQLRELFSSLENWSMVDVSVGYALNNGSVGPHVDSSASIHIMAAGKKKVRIGKRYNPDEIPDDDLLLLKEQLDEELQAEYEFTLEPGDMLYLPECYAHEFTAIDGDSVSYIASFQSAPTWRAINHFASFAKEKGKGFGAFYQNSDSINHDNPGEISKEFINQVKSSFINLVEDDSLVNEWYGCFMTQQDTNHDLLERQHSAYEALRKEKLNLVKAGKLTVNDYLRFAPVKVAYQPTEAGFRLFVGGQYFDIEPEMRSLCEKLSTSRPISSSDVGESKTLLRFLLENKAIA